MTEALCFMIPDVKIVLLNVYRTQNADLNWPILFLLFVQERFSSLCIQGKWPFKVRANITK
jgi:hypothetical protein